MKYTIFSIDHNDSDQVRSNFRAYFSSCGATGMLIDCLGCYKGKQEYSFICLSNDFDAFVWATGWVDNQESVLRVSECNKQYAVLEYAQFDNPIVDYPSNKVHIGSLKSVSKAEALRHDGWTYRPDIDVYFITVKGNPDSVPCEDRRRAEQTLKMDHAMMEVQHLLFGKLNTSQLRVIRGVFEPLVLVPGDL